MTVASPVARRRPSLGAMLALAAAYVLTAQLARVAGPPSTPQPLWVPTGIATGALVMLGVDAWPAVMLGSLVANLIGAGSIPLALGISIGNTIAAAFAAAVVIRTASGADVFDRASDVLRWIVYGGAVANAISATVAVITRLLVGRIAWGGWTQDWIVWWMGNVASTLVVATPIILWWRRPQIRWSTVKLLEGIIFGAALLLVAEAVFGVPLPTMPAERYPRAFLFFPIMAWAAFRLGARAASTVMLVIAFFAVWGTITSHGPFIGSDTVESLLLVQSFLATVAATTMVLSAAVHESQRARRASSHGEERARFLTDASATLSASLDYETTMSTLASLAVPRLGDWCSIQLLDEDGSLRQIALAHVRPDRVAAIQELSDRWPPDPHSPQGAYQVMRTGETIMVPNVTDQMLEQASQTPEHLAFLRSLALQSILIVPLRARDRILGAMTLATMRGSTTYSSTDREMAEELGRRAAIAVDNARLFAQAQEAIRAREDFLAIASHELRTPVTSLRLQVQIVERALGEELARARAATDPAVGADGLERVLGLTGVLGDDSRRLVRLVAGLLDVTRIASGRLDLQPDDLDFRDIVRSGIDSMRPELSARHVALTFRAPLPIPGRWDRLRLEQVVANLLSNAIKYGEGKPILVQASGEGDRVILTVEDQGQGVAPDFVGRMFDRFERGSTGTQGLGLGLYITRQIVESHGGTVEVENRPGAGATFIVRLPRIVEPRRTSSEVTPK